MADPIISSNAPTIQLNEGAPLSLNALGEDAASMGVHNAPESPGTILDNRLERLTQDQIKRLKM